MDRLVGLEASIDVSVPSFSIEMVKQFELHDLPAPETEIGCPETNKENNIFSEVFKFPLSVQHFDGCIDTGMLSHGNGSEAVVSSSEQPVSEAMACDDVHTDIPITETGIAEPSEVVPENDEQFIAENVKSDQVSSGDFPTDDQQTERFAMDVDLPKTADSDKHDDKTAVEDNSMNTGVLLEAQKEGNFDQRKLHIWN